MAKAKPWTDFEVLGNVTSNPPAVRTVLLTIHAYRSGDGRDQWEFEAKHHPISLVESVRVDRYAATGDVALPQFPDVEHLKEAGFWWQDSMVRHRMLFVSDHPFLPDELVCLEDYAIDGDLHAFRFVPCTWPAGQDPKRFAPMLKELQDEAQARITEKQSKGAAA